jgi:hypothetical protein
VCVLHDCRTAPRFAHNCGLFKLLPPHFLHNQVLDTLVEIGAISGATADDARAKFAALHDALASAVSGEAALAQRAQELAQERVVRVVVRACSRGAGVQL